MNNHAKVVFFFQYVSFLSDLFLFSHNFFVNLHPDKSIISQHNEKKHLPFRSLAGRFSRHDGSDQAGRHLGTDALADRENAEDIGCRQGALQCHRCQQYRRLGEEPCQCGSCRHPLQRGDSCAAHPQPEELWPLLDVQRHERAACQLRQGSCRLPGSGVLAGLSLLLRPVGEGQSHASGRHRPCPQVHRRSSGAVLLQESAQRRRNLLWCS